MWERAGLEGFSGGAFATNEDIRIGFELGGFVRRLDVIKVAGVDGFEERFGEDEFKGVVEDGGVDDRRDVVEIDILLSLSIFCFCFGSSMIDESRAMSF